MREHPLVTPELVRFLDAAHPNRCPDPSWTDREVWMAAGAARVIDGLKAALEAQREADTNVIKDPANVFLKPGSQESGAAPGSPDGAPDGPGNRC